MAEPFDDPNLAKVVGEAPPGAPAVPDRPALAPDDPRTPLYHHVVETLQAMPAYFQFATTIEGVHATDLQAANTLLGASIEVQVVATLNRLRELWDPEQIWQGYRFERQSQTFPDVRLVRNRGGNVDVALGIELKGWYLFSKEAVPTFRFTNTPAACAPHDLVCVVPWHFSNVTSGTPVARMPWVESARWAAEYRNYHWQHVRVTNDPCGVIAPENAQPYPTKDQQISDMPEYDGGGNFGRLARVKGLMDTFVHESCAQDALGIPIRDWIAFFKRHRDSADPDDTFAALADRLARHSHGIADDKAERVAGLLREIQRILNDEES